MDKRIRAGRKRRCPYCQSGDWLWLGAVTATAEELKRYLLVRYRCVKCDSEFVVEEDKPTRLVAKADRCVHCRSGNTERVSPPGADLEIWRCKQCNAYMGIR